MWDLSLSNIAPPRMHAPAAPCKKNPSSCKFRPCTGEPRATNLRGEHNRRTEISIRGGCMTAKALRLAGAMSGGLPLAAFSQAPAVADTGTLEEIVVTAEKRTENIQEVPIGIT